MDPTTPGKEFFYKRLLRRSLWALGISGVCNIFAFSYIAIEFEDSSFYVPSQTQKGAALAFDVPKSQSLHQELASVKELPFDALVALLDDKTLACDGYKKQDIALSALVTLHHLHLERVVAATTIQKRIVKFDGKSFRLTPGLTDEEFRLIGSFVTKEEWPFTFEGLHAKLQSEPELSSLKMACAQTREYQHLQALLIYDGKISEEQAHQLILTADFATLTQFKLVAEQDTSKAHDLARRGFLVKLLPNHSQLVAPLLVLVDLSYAVHGLDDQMALVILKNLQEHPKLREEYALGLLVSPRADAVWNEAVVHLCELAKLDPEKETRSTLLHHFGIVKAKPVKKVDAPAVKGVEPLVVKKPTLASKKADLVVTKPEREVATRAQIAQKPQTSTVKPQIVKKPQKAIAEVIHVVKSGDNLWALARKYKVDVQTIKKRNNLQSDALKPGTQLRIPIKTQNSG